MRILTPRKTALAILCFVFVILSYEIVTAKEKIDLNKNQIDDSLEKWIESEVKDDVNLKNSLLIFTKAYLELDDSSVLDLSELSKRYERYEAANACLLFLKSSDEQLRRQHPLILREEIFDYMFKGLSGYLRKKYNDRKIQFFMGGVVDINSQIELLQMCPIKFENITSYFSKSEKIDSKFIIQVEIVNNAKK